MRIKAIKAVFTDAKNNEKYDSEKIKYKRSVGVPMDLYFVMLFSSQPQFTLFLNIIKCLLSIFFDGFVQKRLTIIQV